MSSRSHLHKVRAERRRKVASQPSVLDPDAEVALQSLEGMLEAITQFAESADPLADINAALVELVDAVSGRFCGIDPVRVIEVARLACLPWSFEGQTTGGAERGPTQAELIALIALTACNSAIDRDAGADDRSRQLQLMADTAEDPDPDETADVGTEEYGEISKAIHEVTSLIDRIIQLAEWREIARADLQDRLAMIGAMMRNSEIWIRNTSYPDMTKDTLDKLFGEQVINAVLRSDLGFDVGDALAVLGTCHALQVSKFNDRMQIMGATLIAARSSAASGNTDPYLVAAAQRTWHDAWEPSAAAATISASEIAAATSLPIAVTEAVLRYFTLDMSGKTPQEAVDEFTGGLNPLRTHPVIPAGEGRVMLVHDAQLLVAIRERFETHLKITALWEIYQKHRGDLLESRTQVLFARVFHCGRTQTWNGFQYYVPASEAEAVGDPAAYTKRVEGDHLIVQDDVAVIIEDKAVAISAVARSGHIQRLRRDLTGIIRKAADQASRLQERIEQDGGIRIHDQGWLDLSRIREIHTVAVSLDDLSGASTATAELVKAGLLDDRYIPWTVSVHDLDLITQLIGRPAEFLLYLRRRRDPEATVFYTAPDELDLFLYFFEAGLYVEPDPDKVRVALPWMPPVTTAERRRRRRQRPAYITSRTGALDRWHYAELARYQTQVQQTDQSFADTSNNSPEPNRPSTTQSRALGTETPALTTADEAIRRAAADADGKSQKPSMIPSPLAWLIDTVEERDDYAWLSIGATLLAGATEFQNKLARIPRELLDNPFGDGRQRSQTIPFATSPEDGWLLVYFTRPPERQPAKFERRVRDYLRLKKHQLNLHRGVAFCFDETTRELVGVYFDDHVGELEPELAEQLQFLKSPDEMTGWVPPHAKIRSGSKKLARQNKAVKKKKK
jgi:hypothetical protein